MATGSVAWSATGDGQALFEKRCSACHKLPDPDQPPSAGWAQQLDLMAPLARLKGDQKQIVLDYLVSHSKQASMAASLDEDREFFESKCSRCHTTKRVLLARLQGEEVAHVVSRMQNRSGTDWLSDQDVERVLAYLNNESREKKSSARMSSDITPAEMFAARCSACHTLERIFQKVSDESNTMEFWSHTVSRMRGKAPQWLSETEADGILEYLRSTVVVQK